jgi:hypothetical protein
VTVPVFAKLGVPAAAARCSLTPARGLGAQARSTCLWVPVVPTQPEAAAASGSGLTVTPSTEAARPGKFKLDAKWSRTRVKPRHRATSSGGNEPHFRPAGEAKKIVYENRGVFDKYYLL